MSTQQLAHPEPNYLQILAFETENPHPGPDKNLRIRRELLVTETRYYVLLHRAANSLAGIQAHPITARRVRERADAQAKARASRFAA
ncbi:hypothetical protein GCM10009651_35630 [Microbacterium natoriense]|uniref:DUF3263 domain-containing protein n=1 Tax=Microbacterium natoriense TaxID=284570 RepID=UPI0031D6E3F3